MREEMTAPESQRLERKLDMGWTPGEVAIRFGVGIAILAFLLAFWAGVIILVASFVR